MLTAPPAKIYHEFELKRLDELRLYAPPEKTIEIILVQGDAELGIGMEMVRNRTYEVNWACLFSWFGNAKIIVHGLLESSTFAQDPLDFRNQCTNLAFMLSQKRMDVSFTDSNKKGPSIFVCGYGRGVFCRGLCNYAMRATPVGALATRITHDCSLIYADIDPIRNTIGMIPNSMGWMELNEPFGLETNPQFKRECYFFGKSKQLYNELCDVLTKSVNDHTQKMGSIIRGSRDFEINKRMIQKFKPDLVFVLGDEIMFQALHNCQEIDREIVIQFLKSSSGYKMFSNHDTKLQHKRHLEQCVDNDTIKRYNKLKVVDVEEPNLPGWDKVLPLETTSKLPKYMLTDAIVMDGKEEYAVVFKDKKSIVNAPFDGCAKIRKIIQDSYEVSCHISNLKDATLLVVK
jgi:hypothetical protein